MRGYSEEDMVVQFDLLIIWACNKCDAERFEKPGYNEGGHCECGGQWIEYGESHNA